MQERQSSVRKKLESISLLSESFYFSRLFLSSFFFYLKNDLNPQMAARPQTYNTVITCIVWKDLWILSALCFAPL